MTTPTRLASVMHPYTSQETLMAEAWHFDAALIPQRLVYLQQRLRISVYQEQFGAGSRRHGALVGIRWNAKRLHNRGRKDNSKARWSKKDVWCVSGGGEGGYWLLEANWHTGCDNLICRDSCFCVLKRNLKQSWQEAYPQQERALASPALLLWSWSHMTPKKRSQTACTTRSVATSKNIQHHLGSYIRLVYGATHRPPENPPRSEPSRWSWCDPAAKCNHVGLGTGVDAGRGWGPSTSGSIYLH